MKYALSYFLVVLGFLISLPTKAVQIHQDDHLQERRSFSSHEDFIEALITLKKKIEQAPQADLAQGIKELYREAIAIYHAPESMEGWWIERAVTWKVDYFPSHLRPVNKVKDAVMAYLFYPSQSLEHFVEGQNYSLDTYNSLYRLAFAACHGHTLARYIVADRLRERADINHFTPWEEYPEALQNIFRPVFHDIELAHPEDATYYLITYIKGHMHEWRDMGDYSNDLAKALNAYEKGNHALNRMSILEAKRYASRFYSPPTKEEYLLIAREGYLPAYERVIELDPLNEAAYLEEARQIGYIPYIDRPSALAAKAEMLLGTPLLYNLTNSKTRAFIENPTRVPEEKLKEAEDCLIQAAEKGYTPAWGSLCYFYLILRNYSIKIKSSEEVSYRQKLEAAANQGALMNDKKTYGLLDEFYNGKEFHGKSATAFYMLRLWEDISPWLLKNLN